MRHARIIPLFFAFLLVAPGFTLAEGRSDADEAQRQLDCADARLRDLVCQLDCAQAALNDAVSRRDGALSALDSAGWQYNASARAIADAQNALAAAATDARIAA